LRVPLGKTAVGWLVFDRTFLDTVVRRMDENEDMFKRILDEPTFRQTVLDLHAERLYGRLRAEHDQPATGRARTGERRAIRATRRH